MESFSRRFTSAAVTAVFTFTTVMAVIPPSAFADDDESYLYTDDGFAYIVNDEGTITIKGRDKERDYSDATSIVFPSKIDGKFVTEIDTGDFGHSVYGSNSTITEIVLPDHIEKINNWCFNDYKSLDTVTIPATLKEAVRPFTYCKINKVIIEDGMETVPNELFWCTDYIGELVIPDSVTTIGDRAFSSCAGLKEIHVPDSVKSIGYCAFENNADLEVLDVPDTLDFIGSCAFASNPMLTSATVPDTWTLTEKTEGLFQKCGIKEITFGPERTEIPPSICYSCESLETINWSNAPTKIKSRAFQYCTSLTDPKLPDSVEYIESYAFADCTGITHLDLPASLKDLERQSFDNTTSLRELYVSVQLPYPGDYGRSSAFSNSGIEQLTYAEGITEIHGRFAYLPQLTKVVLPSTLEYIHGYAFENCSSLSHIDIPEGVTEIDGYNVFYGCDSLKELVLPSTLVKSKGALGTAPDLQEVTFTDGIVTIPESVCANCEKLKTVHIPASVTNIATNAFSRCRELEEIDMEQESIEFAHQAFDYCNNLWDERVSFFKEGDLFISKNVVTPGAGGITNYTVYYSMNPRFADNFTLGNLNVWAEPTDYIVIPESLPEGLEPGKYGFEVDLGEPSGIFRFSVRNPEAAEVKISAKFAVKANPEATYAWDTRELTVSDTEFSPITLNVPDTVSKSDGKSKFEVYGITTAGEEVAILINGEEYTKVTSNKYTGKYSASIECEDVNGIITVQAVCGELRSDERKVAVDESMPLLVDVDVTHYTHSPEHWTKDMTDMFTKGATPYVSYNPGHDLTFDIDLDNDDNVDKVIVISETNDKVSFIPLEKNKDTDRWEGSGKFDTTLPGDMYIGQIPKSETGIAEKKVSDDGKVTLEKNGKDILNPDLGEADPVKEIVEKSEIKVEESTDTVSRVKVKYPLGPDLLPPFWEGPTDIEINIMQYISDDLVIDGEKVTSVDAAKDPEEYGFTKSGVKYIDENGNENDYYVRYLTDGTQAGDVAKKITTSGGTADKFLNSGDADISGGVLMLMVDSAAGTATYQSQFWGDNEKSFVKDQAGGVGSSLLMEGLKGGLKGAAQGAAAVVGIVMAAADVSTAYSNYSNDMEQIEYSKNPIVQQNKPMFRARTKAVFYGRVLLITGAAAVGTALACATAVPLAIGIAITAAVGFGAYLLNKFILDPIESNTRKFLYSSNKGNMKCGIDPSGYVYAAVPDNRVEGATATIYYKDDSGKAVKWNAEDYDQVNPQITDSAGWFAWDVPEGMWQVKIEAEGYEDYTTEWLPVLPVQTDINISLRSTAAPTLGSIDAFANGVEVKMSGYIDDSTATADNIYLTDSKGKKIDCKIKPVKSETNDTGYSDTVLLISSQENIAGSTLHITDGLLSYSGVAAKASTKKITEVKDEYLEDDEISLGDVNEDGMVDAKDASMVLVAYGKSSTGAETGLTEAQTKAANVNGDALVDAKDASFILAYYSMASTATGDVPTMAEFMAEKAA